MYIKVSPHKPCDILMHKFMVKTASPHHFCILQMGIRKDQFCKKESSVMIEKIYLGNVSILFIVQTLFEKNTFVESYRYLTIKSSGLIYETLCKYFFSIIIISYTTILGYILCYHFPHTHLVSQSKTLPGSLHETPSITRTKFTVHHIRDPSGVKTDGHF